MACIAFPACSTIPDLDDSFPSRRGNAKEQRGTLDERLEYTGNPCAKSASLPHKKRPCESDLSWIRRRWRMIMVREGMPGVPLRLFGHVT